MPIDNDEIKESYEEAMIRVEAEKKQWTIQNLMEKFNIPKEMEELAYEIWCDGKYN